MTTVELRKYTPTEPGLYLLLFQESDIPELVRLYSSGVINTQHRGSINVSDHTASGGGVLKNAQWSDPLDVRIALRLTPEKKKEF